MIVCVQACYRLALLEGRVWDLNCQLTSLVFFKLLHSRSITPLSLYLPSLSRDLKKEEKQQRCSGSLGFGFQTPTPDCFPRHEHKEELRGTG